MGYIGQAKRNKDGKSGILQGFGMTVRADLMSFAYIEAEQSEQRGWGTVISRKVKKRSISIITGYWVNGRLSDDKPRIEITMDETRNNHAEVTWPAWNGDAQLREDYRPHHKFKGGRSFQGWLHRESGRGFGVIKWSQNNGKRAEFYVGGVMAEEGLETILLHGKYGIYYGRVVIQAGAWKNGKQDGPGIERTTNDGIHWSRKCGNWENGRLNKDECTANAPVILTALRRLSENEPVIEGPGQENKLYSANSFIATIVTTIVVGIMFISSFFLYIR